MRVEGVEPTHLAVLDPKSSVYANSTTGTYPRQGGANIKNTYFLLISSIRYHAK